MSRVLLVDDDDSGRITLAALMELEGHAVIEAASASAARESAGPVDAVVVDWHLGPDDGLALAPELQARWPAARIILLTGASEEAPQGASVHAVVRKGDRFDAWKSLLQSTGP